jgi:hypothetical protein
VNRTELLLQANTIEIRIGAQVLGHLAAGSLAILPAADRPLGNVDIEWAIERAEDWLMPFSRALTGTTLHVRDASGELRQFFFAPTVLEPADIERAFTRAADDVAFGRPMSRSLLAGLVILRELVHHGALSRVELE